MLDAPAMPVELEDPVWQQRLERLDYGYQPIVSFRNGQVLGFEALMRGVDRIGFQTPSDVFDAAIADGQMVSVELGLRAKAIRKFAQRRDLAAESMLFLNVDARMFGAPGYRSGFTVELLRDIGLSPAAICLELAERSEFNLQDSGNPIFEQYRASGIAVAIDDFGVGYASLKMLYEAKPDYLKIDRFFISGIDQDVRKRGLVEQVTNYAHIRGIQVIAEGIETDREFYVCRDIGCDFAQGYRIARPTTDLAALSLVYQAVLDLNSADRRRTQSSGVLVEDAIQRIPAIPAQTQRADLLETFRQNDMAEVVPVVDERGRPLGVVRERDIKHFAYSRFGSDLLRNRAIGDGIRDLIVTCPVCNIGTHIDRIVEAFSGDSAADGILMTEDGRYVGFLSPRSLLKLVNEYNLAGARDQNPLSRLPGNQRIQEWIDRALDNPTESVSVAFIDFDFFKPFNDTYGFRQGDRVITMFADMMRHVQNMPGFFAGHIGGDDFVLGALGVGQNDMAEALETLLEKFRTDVSSLYEPESRVRGHILAKDRDGRERQFPLLRASAVMLYLPARADGASSHPATAEDIAARFAARKSEAKGSLSGVVIEQMA